MGSLIPATSSSKAGAVTTSNKCDGTLALLVPLEDLRGRHHAAVPVLILILGLALGHLAFRSSADGSGTLILATSRGWILWSVEGPFRHVRTAPPI